MNNEGAKIRKLFTTDQDKKATVHHDGSFLFVVILYQ